MRNGFSGGWLESVPREVGAAVPRTPPTKQHRERGEGGQRRNCYADPELRLLPQPLWGSCPSFQRHREMEEVQGWEGDREKERHPERSRDRERETERQGETEKRQRHRERGRDRDGERQRKKDRDKGRRGGTETQRGRETEK